MSQRAASKAVQKGSHPFNTFEAIIPGVSQKVAVGATSAQSAALTAGISVARLVSTVACHVKTGANPTAVADGTCLYLPANSPILLGVNGGDKIAVIEDSAGGNLFITEGAPNP